MPRFKAQVTTWPLGRTTEVWRRSSVAPYQLSDIKITETWAREQRRLGIERVTVALLEESGRSWRLITSEMRDL